jgi:hypothetical protein
VNKYSLRNVALLIGASVPVALATYGVSFWLLQLYWGALASYYGPSASYSSAYQSPEILVFDAILLILGGAAFLLGSGGISRNTSRAAQIASVASAFGKETIGPSEIMRRDAWKPKGYLRLELILIVAGIFLSSYLFFGSTSSLEEQRGYAAQNVNTFSLNCIGTRRRRR